MPQNTALALLASKPPEQQAMACGEGWVRAERSELCAGAMVGVDPTSGTVLAVRLLGPPEVRRWEQRLRRLAKGLPLHVASAHIRRALREPPMTKAPHPRCHGARLVRRAWREARQELQTRIPSLRKRDRTPAYDPHVALPAAPAQHALPAPPSAAPAKQKRRRGAARDGG